MELSKFRATLPAVLLTILVAVIAPLFASGFWLTLLATVAVFAIAVIGLNVLTGLAGQVSFATTAFMASGGYGAAILTTRYHQNPWMAMLLGALFSGLGAVVIGYPMLRLRGHYLALGTFALALAAVGIAAGATSITGGAIGIPGVPPPNIGPVSLASPGSFYATVWLMVAFCIAAMLSLKRSRIGRAWMAIATREDVASSLGIDVRRFKVMAFVFASVVASISGSLYVELTSFIAPDVFSIDIAIQVFAMLFIGGVGTTFGPIVGSAVIIVLPAIFTSLRSSETLISEIVLLAIVVLFPQGLGRIPKGSSFVGRLVEAVRVSKVPSNG